MISPFPRPFSHYYPTGMCNRGPSQHIPPWESYKEPFRARRDIRGPPSVLPGIFTDFSTAGVVRCPEHGAPQNWITVALGHFQQAPELVSAL